MLRELFGEKKTRNFKVKMMFRSCKNLLKYSSTCSYRQASTLVVAEHDGKVISQGTLACITAATKIGGDISLLIAGKDINDVVASASKVVGPKKILTVTSEVPSFNNKYLDFFFQAVDHGNGENIAKTVQKVASKGFTHVLAPSSNTGKNFMPRLGALMDASPLTDILEVMASAPILTLVLGCQ